MQPCHCVREIVTKATRDSLAELHGDADEAEALLEIVFGVLGKPEDYWTLTWGTKNTWRVEGEVDAILFSAHRSVNEQSVQADTLVELLAKLKDTKLLPCPFCGEKAVDVRVRSRDWNGWIGCEREGHAPLYFHYTDSAGGREPAVVRWNTRA